MRTEFCGRERDHVMHVYGSGKTCLGYLNSHIVTDPDEAAEVPYQYQASGDVVLNMIVSSGVLALAERMTFNRGMAIVCLMNGELENAHDFVQREIDLREDDD